MRHTIEWPYCPFSLYSSIGNGSKVLRVKFVRALRTSLPLSQPVKHVLANKNTELAGKYTLLNCSRNLLYQFDNSEYFELMMGKSTGSYAHGKSIMPQNSSMCISACTFQFCESFIWSNQSCKNNVVAIENKNKS